MRAFIIPAGVVLTSVAPAPKAQKVYRGPDSDFIAPYQEVIRDSAEWRSVWATTGGRPDPDGNVKKVPNINFKRKMVIVAANPATAPDSVVIRPDPKGAKGVFSVITYRSCTPGAKKTMPVDIIAIPADPGSVMFLDKTVKGPGCTAA